MQSTSSDAQVTQAGQAIAINAITCEQLLQLFSPMLGPNGTLKALVSGGLQLNLTKDGLALCRDVKFVHPTSIIITRSAVSLYNSSGDGTISFILLCSKLFLLSYNYHLDGTSIPNIINSLQLALKDTIEFTQKSIVPLTDETLKQLAYSILSTKLYNPNFLVDILIKSLVTITSTGVFDVDMVEIMKMEGGDLSDSIFVDGLVLDHSGRHYAMPTSLDNVCVMICNISLEYEKPEINSEFCYSSATQREQFSIEERKFITDKASEIAKFAIELKKEGKNLLVVNEKGIDPFSLEILSNAGVLALRRAKRRNLERLFKMCGGKIITQISQISKDNVGFCKKVTVHDFGENKFTFLEGTPFKGSCTILIRGNTDYERISKSIKGTLQSMMLAIQSKCCIKGGIYLYKGIMDHLNTKLETAHESDAVGYKILIQGFEYIIKTLLRNQGKNVQENLVKINRGEIDGNVIDNVKVFSNVVSSSVFTSVNLLMCDEIIRAGKSIKQDKMEN